MGPEVDIAALILRILLGSTLVAHGWNHAFGKGGIRGTAKWFESIGMAPGRTCAFFSTITEVGAGIMLILGVLIPFAAAGVIGTMTVALVTNHIKNGYFIFSKGGGYEYVLNLILATLAVAALGAGRVSIDALIKIDFGWSRLPISLVMGLLSAVLILAIVWRPGRVAQFRND